MNKTQITSDLEFYCHMKMSLPAGYLIMAEPRTSYYSEWLYCYKVFRGKELVEVLEGDFRTVAPGTLVAAAKRILGTIGEQSC